MTPAQRKFLKIVKDEHYFDKDSKILLALSGGKDSMTLFNWLYDLKEVLGIELGLAHINHGLREESKFEEIYNGCIMIICICTTNFVSNRYIFRNACSNFNIIKRGIK